MSDTKGRLGRDVFMALAAIGWADGKLDADEADAIVRTALDEGFSIEEIEEIEAATKNPIQLADIDLSKLTKEDRLFIYAVATWMSATDGVVSETEKSAIGKLGDMLKIPEKPRAHAEAIAAEVAASSAGNPIKFDDLPKVRTIINERLAEARKAKAEAAKA